MHRKASLLVVPIIAVISIGSFFAIQNDMLPEFPIMSETETTVSTHNPQERSRDLKNDESSSVEIGLPGMLKKPGYDPNTLPQYSPSPSQPIPQKSSYSSGFSWFGTSSSFDFAKLERELRQAKSEEEINQIVQQAANSPEHLSSCAKLFEELKKEMKILEDFQKTGRDPATNPRVMEALEKFDNFYNRTFCMAVKDKWLKQ